jgi:hypothetical protein
MYTYVYIYINIYVYIYICIYTGSVDHVTSQILGNYQIPPENHHMYNRNLNGRQEIFRYICIYNLQIYIYIHLYTYIYIYINIYIYICNVNI